MKADILRENFLEFFKSKRHKIIDSDSLVPGDDPTILFTPAGMNQFKKEFLGFDSGFTRAASSQRCLRTDDLDKVGQTCGHHTFFEMLGNFSFGDYFKKEAIAWAWEFLTGVLKIKKERLWVSVYKEDEEAHKVWKDSIKIAQNKIIKLGDKENFWPSEAKEKGPNGPCGPCSEIFFDQGKKVGCGKSNCNPSCTCDRFVEVWNLVFTQYNRRQGGKLEPLPKKNIDTGMGLERLAAVMQGALTNFETNLFQPIVKEINSQAKSSPNMKTIYAVADHLRAIVFAIFDGALPSNESRGYVVRKLIRRSLLHLRSLGIKQAFLYKLVPVLSEVMKRPYPELEKRKENIAEIILAEEKGFISTLNSSENLFKDKFKEILKKGNPKEAGRISFQLYDTYGIPLELTENWLKKQGIKISKKAFEEELVKQKARSKSQSAMKGDVFAVEDLDYGLKETKFLGYQDYANKAKIIKIIQDDAEVKKAGKQDRVSIILDETVFYPESGGQVGDIGEFVKGKNVFEVLDTKKVGKVIVHLGRVKAGVFKAGDSLTAKLNLERRLSIARNHTATHLLQAALRKILGAHVRQQGSLVAEERLRFDFTHFKDISGPELSRVEDIVNTSIMDNYAVESKVKSIEEAKKSGALAFFAEKYTGKVRVITIDDISKELCGGTHLNFTGQIGPFKITQEGSVARGLRRIESITGSFAYKKIKEERSVISEVSSSLNVAEDKILEEIEKKTARLKELEKRLNTERMDILKSTLDDVIQRSRVIKDIKVVTQVIEDLDMDLLRKNVDLIKEKAKSAVIALGTQNGERALLVIGVTPDLCLKGLDASRLIRELAAFIGGSGGGRNDFAQAGGNKPESFPQAFKKLEEIIQGI